MARIWSHELYFLNKGFYKGLGFRVLGCGHISYDSNEQMTTSSDHTFMVAYRLFLNSFF